jgi:hypothetical protein
MIELIRKIRETENNHDAYNSLFEAIKNAGMDFATSKNRSQELGLFLAGVATDGMMKDIKRGTIYNDITPEECLNAYLILAFKEYAKGENP